MNHSFDVCIVGLKCYDLLTDAQVPRYLGGIEKQLVCLAQGLSNHGARVSFITYDHGQEPIVEHKGVTIFKSFGPDEGIPGLRYIHPRNTMLWATMKKTDAAVFLQMGSGSETGTVAIGSRLAFLKKRPFVFCLASNADYDKSLPYMPLYREKKLYQFGLKRADRVISQTVWQQMMLNKNFKIQSDVIPMPYKDADLSSTATHTKSAPTKSTLSERILWVGRIIEVKRLEWLLDVAEMLPGYQFEIVGTPNTEDEYSKNNNARAAAISNVIVHGRVSEADLQRLFSEASLLCCTSIIEGFPTTFMEAWHFELPVVTTFDPDNIIEKNNLGLIAETREELAKQIKFLINQPEERRQFTARAKEYFEKNHSIKATVPKFLDAIRSVQSL